MDNMNAPTVTFIITTLLGTAVAQWLRCCATNQKVAGSIPAGVSEFFIDIKSFRSHYGPGVDSGVFPGGKSGQCIRLTTYHHPVLSQNLGTLTSWNSMGLSRPVTGPLYSQLFAEIYLGETSRMKAITADHCRR